jgi:hypothetical protein
MLELPANTGITSISDKIAKHMSRAATLFVFVFMCIAQKLSAILITGSAYALSPLMIVFCIAGFNSLNWPCCVFMCCRQPGLGTG